MPSTLRKHLSMSREHWHWQYLQLTTDDPTRTSLIDVDNGRRVIFSAYSDAPCSSSLQSASSSTHAGPSSNVLAHRKRETIIKYRRENGRQFAVLEAHETLGDRLDITEWRLNGDRRNTKLELEEWLEYREDWDPGMLSE